MKLIDSYFADRYCRVRLGPVISDWEPVIRGCPQGSAFGPLLWNIFQNDLTYCVDSNLNMYADDHQFYSADNTVTNVYNSLLANAESASGWYKANFLKGNLDKYQTMTLGSKQNPDNNLNIDNYEVKSANYLKLLGVSIDNNLRFEEHINNICKKSNQRIGVLMRLKNMIPTVTKLQLYKAAILPHLTYCHLTWHFCRASDTRKIERVQEKALRAVFIDKTSTYTKLLEMAGLCTL